MISVHYQSGDEFLVNPENITALEWMPAEKLTRIDVVGQYGAYKCVENPEQINGLVDSTKVATGPDLARRPDISGVGGSGPVYGDGSNLEVRSDGDQLADSGDHRRSHHLAGGGRVDNLQGVPEMDTPPPGGRRG